jgi:hypothetical protein
MNLSRIHIHILGKWINDIGNNVTTSFIFDRYGSIYLLVDSNKSIHVIYVIHVIDSTTGSLQYKLPLDTIPLESTLANTSNSIWVDNLYSLFIAAPDSNKVYQVVFDPNANYNASICIGIQCGESDICSILIWLCVHSNG